jgi:hypothetical protein
MYLKLVKWPHYFKMFFLSCVNLLSMVFILCYFQEFMSYKILTMTVFYRQCHALTPALVLCHILLISHHCQTQLYRQEIEKRLNRLSSHKIIVQKNPLL